VTVESSAIPRDVNKAGSLKANAKANARSLKATTKAKARLITE